jgi:predicted nucleic acid-binding protein
MTTYALDTNTISYYMKENPIVRKNSDKMLKLDASIVLVPFAYYEVKRGIIDINSTRLQLNLDMVCNTFPTGNIDNAILDVAAGIYVELKHNGKRGEEIDILIAAYCKYNNFTWVTNNTDHFTGISGLNIIDWTKRKPRC